MQVGQLPNRFAFCHLLVGSFAFNDTEVLVMARVFFILILVVAALSALVSAGPTIVSIADALVPVVLVIGGLAIAGRIVWHYTSRY